MSSTEHAPELRGPLSEGLHRLSDDVRLGRHGDPHVGFVVLAYPDREPAVLAVREYAYNLAELRAADDNEEGDPFPKEEFDQAKDAMDDASLGFIIGQHRLGTDDPEVGVCIAEQIARGWDRRRTQDIDQALAIAAHKAEHPFQCPTCKRRFRTERGMKMHQSRTRAMRCKVDQ